MFVFFFSVFVLLTEVGKLLFCPKLTWVLLYSRHKAQLASASLHCSARVLLLSIFGRGPNPLFNLAQPLLLLAVCSFLSSFSAVPFSPSPSPCLCTLSSLSPSLFLPFLGFQDLPGNIEHVNSVSLKLGFGRRDQRCPNRITVPNHMGPQGTDRHPSLWCICAPKLFFLRVYETRLYSLYLPLCVWVFPASSNAYFCITMFFTKLQWFSIYIKIFICLLFPFYFHPQNRDQHSTCRCSE